MRHLVFSALTLVGVVGCGGSDGKHQLPDSGLVTCQTAAERTMPCTVTVVPELLQFETQNPPEFSVQLAYNTAWDVPQRFPTTCEPLALAVADSSNGFRPRLDNVSCASSNPRIIMLMADDVIGGNRYALSINDKKLPAPVAGDAHCLDMAAQHAAPRQARNERELQIADDKIVLQQHQHQMIVVAVETLEGGAVALIERQARILPMFAETVIVQHRDDARQVVARGTTHRDGAAGLLLAARKRGHSDFSTVARTHQFGRSPAIERAALSAAARSANNPKQVAPLPDMRASSEPGAVSSAVSTDSITGQRATAAPVRSLRHWPRNFVSSCASAKRAGSDGGGAPNVP